MKKYLQLLRQFAHNNGYRILLVLVVSVTLTGMFIGYRLLLFRKSVQLSYGQQTCFSDQTVLPNLFQPKNSKSFTVELTDQKQIAGYPIFAGGTCIKVINPPTEHANESVKMAVLGNAIINKQFRVTATAYPKVLNSIQQPLSIRDSLGLQLDKPDSVFRYHIQVADKQEECSIVDDKVNCDINELGLKQGVTYPVRLNRYFVDQKLDNLIEEEVLTTLPIEVVDSSIKPAAVIYDKPEKLTINTNQVLKDVEATLESISADSKRTSIAAKVSTLDKQIVVQPDKALARDTKFELVVKKATSIENGYLEKTYILPFSVSGGPRVTAVNIGNKSVDLNSFITISFDQDIDPKQDLSKLISLKNAGVAMAFTATAQGKTITIHPNTAFSFCAVINLAINNDVKSAYGISGNSAWTLNSRAICHTVSIIGYSVQGRPIYAWRFGNGPSKILFLGTTHGDEKSTKYLMDTWVQDLEANPDKIPAHRTVIVVPNLSPDGFASGSRRNAAGVDLNRNFPANNWKSDVTMPGGQLVTGGGGVQALSEPESQAIASLVQSESLRLVLTYHSAAALVSPNGSGDSVGLADSYSATSGYGVLPFGQNDTVFHYDTTGAFEDWLHDKLAIPTILVELGSSSNSQWAKNKSAMWNMATLP